MHFFAEVDEFPPDNNYGLGKALTGDKELICLLEGFQVDQMLVVDIGVS